MFSIFKAITWWLFIAPGLLPAYLITGISCRNKEKLTEEDYIELNAYSIVFAICIWMVAIPSFGLKFL